MSDLVKATWIAPYEAQLADGTLLVPGKTVCRIPATEAEQSSNWQPEAAAKTPKQTEGES